MDPLSMTASISAILQLAGTVLNYLNDVKDASKDRARIATEASNVYSLLTTLRYRVEEARSGDPWFIAVRTLGVGNGPLDHFKVGLEQLAAKLGPANGLRKVGKMLTWKFDKTEIDGILFRIERMKTLIGLALTNDLL